MAIPIDSGALARARNERRALDSAARDTTLKPNERALVAYLRVQRILTAQETLARLGYAVAFTGDLDQATRAAMHSFERYHGLPLSDDPAVPELSVALAYVDGLTSNTFSLPELNVYTAMWAGQLASVHAKGTWWRADPPRQTSEIWCYRSQSECQESMAYLVNGELYTGTMSYAVERWDNDELVARSTALCVNDVLTINRARQTAVLVRSSRNDNNKACQIMRTKSDDAVFQLTDGHAVVDSLSREALKYVRIGPHVSAGLKSLDSISRQ